MVLSVFEETALLSYGKVLGMELDPMHCNLKGWWYAIQFTHGPDAGYRDWIPQCDVWTLNCGPQANN